MHRGTYIEKVYAGVLGKLIGVYMGRPIEGWEYERIVRQLGTVSTYVHERLGLPLVVTDDDLSGTFTFVRAVEDHGFVPELSPQLIGETWLNYLVEGKTILWWGGRGTSTEHTAYLNLKSGIPAPRSGAAGTNGHPVANQIGGMIFIDSWAMLAPGDPVRASQLARAAASVSHDDEALHAAAFVAAMEALAFVEPDLDALLEAGLHAVPPHSAIARQAGWVRRLHAEDPDWRAARARLDAEHGYHRYPGTCHVIPNFSLILLALLYGRGDFRECLTVVNTCGWDTDCNAANLGCLLGIRNGLAAIEACPDLRLPPRDQMYLSSADGGRAITDAAREASSLVNVYFRMHDEPPFEPKGGARLPFAFRGAVHGARALSDEDATHEVAVEARAFAGGETGLVIDFRGSGRPARVVVPVFVPPGAKALGSYDLQASPSLYPGQMLTAMVSAPPSNESEITARLFVTAYGDRDAPRRHFGAPVPLAPEATTALAWKVSAGGDYPLFEAGLELTCASQARHTVNVTSIDWRGVPAMTWGRTRPGATAWKRAWVNAVDAWPTEFRHAFHLSQNQGVGLVIQGLREWQDYAVSADVELNGLRAGGIGVRVQGLRRYYALLLDRAGSVRLVKERSGTHVLAERNLPIEESRAYALRLSIRGKRLVAWVDGGLLFDLTDEREPLESGAVALVVQEGTLLCDSVRVEVDRKEG